MYKFLTILILVYIAFSTCKKKSDDFENFSDNPKIPPEIFLVELSKKIFKDEWKETKVEKVSSGLEVLIEFGGKSALSFRSQDSFENEMKYITADYIWKFLRYSSARDIKLLKLSLTKPFYVNEETIKKEVIEEFEVFRVSVDPLEIKIISDFQTLQLTPIATSEKDSKRFKVLDEIIKRWKVELNEFKRVEIK